MPLVPRVQIVADDDDLAVAAVLADLSLLSERLGVGTATNMVLPDSREREAVHDVMLASLRRVTLAGSAKVTRHNCPHVTGSEEPSWGPCTDPQYAYAEENV